MTTARSSASASTDGRRIIITASNSGSHLFHRQQPAFDDDDDDNDDGFPTLVILVPKNGYDRISKFGVSSPVESPSLTEAAIHLAVKTRFFCDGRLRTRVGTVDYQDDDDDNVMSRCDVDNADIVLAYGLETVEEVQMARDLFATRRELSFRRLQQQDYGNSQKKKYICHMGIDCAESLPAMVGPYYDDETNSILAALAATFLPWSNTASGRRLHDKMNDLFRRATTDDFCTAIVLFLNQFVTPVDWVRYDTAATWEKGILRNALEFKELVTKCGDYLIPCVQDKSCRTCLTQLTKVDPRDQALSYRTIVSYESDLLTKFTLCAFTKHNVFQCQATIPTKTTVPPLTVWRDASVTDAVARALLVGHLQGEASSASSSLSQRLDVSWKVACGANVAYDQFPCQNQLFYPSSGSNDKIMWYDPVFRVQTLDGRNIWCKRHYRVRQRDENPATFRLSVSDNGVTSDEYWTIVGAADDLSWIVFHYAGAAQAVGLRYLGGLLCTPDGFLPQKADDLAAIWHCFQSAGIQPWELYVVDNRVDTVEAVDAGQPPLTFYRQGVMELRKKKSAVAPS